MRWLPPRWPARSTSSRVIGLGLRQFEPARHRIAEVGRVDDVLYIDDSKATNAHAADMSLRLRSGGLDRRGAWPRGSPSTTSSSDMRGGCGRSYCWAPIGELILAALQRHAPDVPVEVVTGTDTGAMQEVVTRAAGLAQTGTRCSWRRDAPHGTCSPTTPSGAVSSQPPCPRWRHADAGSPGVLLMWHVVPGGETLRRWWNHPLANYALLLSTTMLLLVLGIVMVFSASNVVTYAAGDGVGLTVTQKQLMFAVVGLAAMVLISRASVAGIRKAAPYLLIAAFIGLFRCSSPDRCVRLRSAQLDQLRRSLPVPAQRTGQTRDHRLGADLLTRKRKVIHEWRHLLVPLVPVWFAIVVLIVLEGDLGTTIVMFPILASLLFVIGAPARVFGVAFGGLLVMVAVLSVTVAYRMQRFRTWLDPASDPAGPATR